MVVGCLAWGSLVWKPEGLPVRRPWFDDGPLLPIEFARHSKGDRITLVLVEGAHHVRSLWALMSVAELERAKSALAEREGIEADNIQKHIGWWSQTSDSGGSFVAAIREWAIQRAMDGVVWTALSPKFEGTEGRVPTAAELVAFFRGLPYEKRRHAEEYVRRAPLQIDTENRRVIEVELGWRPIVDDRVRE